MQRYYGLVYVIIWNGFAHPLFGSSMEISFSQGKEHTGHRPHNFRWVSIERIYLFIIFSNLSQAVKKNYTSLYNFLRYNFFHGIFLCTPQIFTSMQCVMLWSSTAKKILKNPIAVTKLQWGIHSSQQKIPLYKQITSTSI